jgi:Domain of unknown function (DUF4410)
LRNFAKKPTSTEFLRAKLQERDTMRFVPAILAVSLLLSPALAAKDAPPSYKTVEAKHFTRVEGVELSPAFTDYLYAELRNELTKTKMFAHVIGEGEAVDDTEAAASIVIDGVITEYKKGNRAADAIIGFGAGARSLRLDANLTRRSDHQSLGAIKIHVRVSPRWNEQVMAKAAAHDIANEVKKELKQK